MLLWYFATLVGLAFATPEAPLRGFTRDVRDRFLDIPELKSVSGHDLSLLSLGHDTLPKSPPRPKPARKLRKAIPQEAVKRSVLVEYVQCAGVDISSFPSQAKIIADMQVAADYYFNASKGAVTYDTPTFIVNQPSTCPNLCEGLSRDPYINTRPNNDFMTRIYVQIPAASSKCAPAEAAVDCEDDCDVYVYGGWNLATMLHEFGHNFGLHHSGVPGEKLDYKDYSSIMGTSFSEFYQPINIAHLHFLGWTDKLAVFKDAGAEDIFQGWIYSAATEDHLIPAGEFRGVSIWPMGEPSRYRYYIAYRNDERYMDAFLSNPTIQASTAQYGAIVDRTQILELDSQSGKTIRLATLGDGETFEIQAAGITVTQHEQSLHRARITVAEKCVEDYPDVEVLTSIQKYGSVPVTHTVQLTNLNSVDCSQTKAFTLEYVPDDSLADWTITMNPTSVTLSPGQSGNVTVTITAPAAATGLHYINIYTGTGDLTTYGWISVYTGQVAQDDSRFTLGPFVNFPYIGETSIFSMYKSDQVHMGQPVYRIHVGDYLPPAIGYEDYVLWFHDSYSLFFFGHVNQLTSAACISSVNQCQATFIGRMQNGQTNILDVTPNSPYQIEQLLPSCSFTPCLNGAGCQEKPLSDQFECIAPAGYYGDRSDLTIVDPCAQTTCQNEGKCEVVAGSPVCQCRTGYSGPNCEIVADKCAQYQAANNEPACLNGALCENLIEAGEGIIGLQCLCQSGWKGLRCEAQINYCKADSCKNGGTCKPLVGGFECDCPDGTAGSDCSVVITTKVVDPCESNPCENSGVCESSADGSTYTCSCLSPWIGDRCTNVEPTACNNGVAVLTSPGYKCECQTGYEGEFCDKEKDPCTSTPCENGGTCTKTSSKTYSCQCPTSHTGVNCTTPACDNQNLQGFHPLLDGVWIKGTTQQNGETVNHWFHKSNTIYYIKKIPTYGWGIGRSLTAYSFYCILQDLAEVPSLATAPWQCGQKTSGIPTLTCDADNCRQSNPCNGHGVCTDDVGLFHTCKCEGGYGGSICDIENVDSCKINVEGVDGDNSFLNAVYENKGLYQNPSFPNNNYNHYASVNGDLFIWFAPAYNQWLICPFPGTYQCYGILAHANERPADFNPEAVVLQVYGSDHLEDKAQATVTYQCEAAASAVGSVSAKFQTLSVPEQSAEQIHAKAGMSWHMALGSSLLLAGLLTTAAVWYKSRIESSEPMASDIL